MPRFLFLAGVLKGLYIKDGVGVVFDFALI